MSEHTEAASDYERRLSSLLDEVKTLLVKKHHDYGEKNLTKRGNLGILVRIEDKVSRLDHILKDGAQVDNETVKDAWMDIIGYAIQAIVLGKELK